VSTKPTSFLP
jgi:hypothetical protein